MKPLSASEIQNLVQELKAFEGSRLQEVRLSGSLLALGLYMKQLFWWVLDLDPVAPQIVMLDSLSHLKWKDEKKPMLLFLRAHILGRTLRLVEAPRTYGRVLTLYFSGEGEAQVEVRLFPRGQNVIVRANGKEMSLYKPAPLKVVEELLPEMNNNVEQGEGLFKKISEKWIGQRGVPHAGSVATTGVTFDDLMKQKESKLVKAMAKIAADIEEKQKAKWFEVGEWLKTRQTLEVPVEYSEYVDSSLGFAENLENCFNRAKEIKRKLLGTQLRYTELSKELAEVRAGRWRPPAPPSSKGLMRSAKAKGRTFDLGDGLILYVGKSGEDNLRLLREARPWFYWLHLRDEPSAHGILHRKKQQNISDNLLHQAVHYLIATTYGTKSERRKGEKFDVLLAECRYVRPVKGAAPGRVTYSHERKITHLFSASVKKG